jgi:hypothetical protein
MESWRVDPFLLIGVKVLITLSSSPASKPSTTTGGAAAAAGASTPGAAGDGAADGLVNLAASSSILTADVTRDSPSVAARRWDVPAFVDGVPPVPSDASSLPIA